MDVLWWNLCEKGLYIRVLVHQNVFDWLPPWISKVTRVILNGHFEQRQTVVILGNELLSSQCKTNFHWEQTQKKIRTVSQGWEFREGEGRRYPHSNDPGPVLFLLNPFHLIVNHLTLCPAVKDFITFSEWFCLDDLTLRVVKCACFCPFRKWKWKLQSIANTN